VSKKPPSKPAKDDPATRLPNGRLVKGHPPLPGQGRPPGLRMRTLIEQRSADGGMPMTLPETMLAVYKSMVARALKGDVPAAKLVKEWACEPDDAEAPGVVVNVQPATANAPPPEQMTQLIDDLQALRDRVCPPEKPQNGTH
jgi:hypothetical protein